MKSRLGRIGLILLATSFSLMTLSPPALAKIDPQIKALQEEIQLIKKTQLKPAQKAGDKDLVEELKQEIKDLRAEIKQIRASNKA